MAAVEDSESATPPKMNMEPKYVTLVQMIPFFVVGDGFRFCSLVSFCGSTSTFQLGRKGIFHQKLNGILPTDPVQ